MSIAKCANCQKDIELGSDAQTSCSKCDKDFCFGMFSTCFTDYHLKNNLFKDHSALSICNPSWKINLRSNEDE